MKSARNGAFAGVGWGEVCAGEALGATTLLCPGFGAGAGFFPLGERAPSAVSFPNCKLRGRGNMILNFPDGGLYSQLSVHHPGDGKVFLTKTSRNNM